MASISNVEALCTQIRAERDVGLLPFLADALDDEGRRDTAEMVRLVCQLKPTWVSALEMAALAQGGEFQKSLEWLRGLAEELGGDGGQVEDDGYDTTEYYGPWRDMTLQRLVLAADDWIKHREYLTQSGSDSWRDWGWSAGNMEEFWSHYAQFTGESWAPDKDGKWNLGGSFFSCSC